MSDIESHPERPAPTLRYKSGSTVRTIETVAPQSTVSRIRRAAPLNHIHAAPKLTANHNRKHLREPCAEFLGTLILVFFGTAANCQTVLLSNGTQAKGGWLSGAIGWGVGIALGVFVSAAVSGGHINPAVTLTQAIFRRFPWKKVPFYWGAQLLGAFFGSLVTYGIYRNAIDQFEGKGVRTVPGTAGLFGTFPLDYVPADQLYDILLIILTTVVAFFNEVGGIGCSDPLLGLQFLATIFLVLSIFAATDRNNGPSSPALVAVAVFFAMTGITAAMGAQTSFAMNPARDLGPRMMSAMFYGRKVFTFRHNYWIWGPIIADFSGALAAATLYDLLIYVGSDSPIAYR
ncbi:hypothetical protein M407DRAFT_83283 [Tulasnella calospora MUT 4182]|uniref:Aquaporin n=1 Tax=Tulasnella calospora MUT 4182 TaxID=1051891 RepID=A0A0C3Q5U4_9AGAM|nr:hypothetical protein M407DRAFT_83283 [Tulasnella calospora MUT 4182]